MLKVELLALDKGDARYNTICIATVDINEVVRVGPAEFQRAA